MPDSKVQALSVQLCDLLGANSSNKNVDKVSAALVDLLSEITETNAKAYNKIVRNCCDTDKRLASQITDDIKGKRDALIANLSALR